MFNFVRLIISDDLILNEIKIYRIFSYTHIFSLILITEHLYIEQKYI